MTPKRTILRVPLEPLTGSRFQPTGFPDLGPALFERPLADGRSQRCLLVESNQSMANRLEGTAWDTGANRPVELLARLPWVQVVAADDGRYLTSSRTEPHRLASAFVKQSELEGQAMTAVVKDRLGLRDDTPLAPRQIAQAVFALDPLCLVHGVFFADTLWPGQPRVARALTGSIEARDVNEAVSGGVKRDSVRHSLADSEGGTAEGYGSVPFHRVEYTAREIEATFVLDLAQLDAYGLPGPARDLLEAVALWEVRQLLDGGLRLRTACDFAVSDPSQVTLPTGEELEERVRADIEACGALIEGPVPLTVSWAGGKKKAAK